MARRAAGSGNAMARYGTTRRRRRSPRPWSCGPGAIPFQFDPDGLAGSTLAAVKIWAENAAWLGAFVGISILAALAIPGFDTDYARPLWPDLLLGTTGRFFVGLYTALALVQPSWVADQSDSPTPATLARFRVAAVAVVVVLGATALARHVL